MTSESVVLSTLCYHDLFDYPLTIKELHRFLIGKKVSLKKLKPKIKSFNGFHFLPGRKKIIALRQKREKISQQKLTIARQVSRWLRLIPTIKLIAVTGAVAVNNAKKKDDIDLLIITAANRLWLTRFFSLLLSEILGRRRKIRDIDTADKICFNIWLDENHLALPKLKRNLFTAHEICQMQVIQQKNNLYQKFLNANQWSAEFLPNWKK